MSYLHLDKILLKAILELLSYKSIFTYIINYISKNLEYFLSVGHI